MSYWTTCKLAESHLAELRSQASRHHLKAQLQPAGPTRTGALRSRLRRRLGHLLVEAGLRLLTTPRPRRLPPSPAAVAGRQVTTPQRRPSPGRRS